MLNCIEKQYDSILDCHTFKRANYNLNIVFINNIIFNLLFTFKQFKYKCRIIELLY